MIRLAPDDVQLLNLVGGLGVARPDDAARYLGLAQSTATQRLRRLKRRGAVRAAPSTGRDPWRRLRAYRARQGGA